AGGEGADADDIADHRFSVNANKLACSLAATAVRTVRPVRTVRAFRAFPCRDLRGHRRMPGSLPASAASDRRSHGAFTVRV
ncbi:MAG: hypothetical protein QUU85_06340, partial [Candidatus Eisenbacteria bacterium]|nr:hypothetical protein [Candidatus Eisenbacteria bacterium]